MPPPASPDKERPPERAAKVEDWAVIPWLLPLALKATSLAPRSVAADRIIIYGAPPGLGRPINSACIQDSATIAAASHRGEATTTLAGMQHSAELRRVSADLLARARELRQSAEAARVRSERCRKTAEAVRRSGKASRGYSDAARKRQDERC